MSRPRPVTLKSVCRERANYLMSYLGTMDSLTCEAERKKVQQFFKGIGNEELGKRVADAMEQMNEGGVELSESRVIANVTYGYIPAPKTTRVLLDRMTRTGDNLLDLWNVRSLNREPDSAIAVLEDGMLVAARRSLAARMEGGRDEKASKMVMQLQDLHNISAAVHDNLIGLYALLSAACEEAAKKSSRGGRGAA